jgi:hypothetical protein
MSRDGKVRDSVGFGRLGLHVRWSKSAIKIAVCDLEILDLACRDTLHYILDIPVMEAEREETRGRRGWG